MLTNIENDGIHFVRYHRFVLLLYIIYYNYYFVMYYLLYAVDLNPLNVQMLAFRQFVTGHYIFCYT